MKLLTILLFGALAHATTLDLTWTATRDGGPQSAAIGTGQLVLNSADAPVAFNFVVDGCDWCLWNPANIPTAADQWTESYGLADLENLSITLGADNLPVTLGLDVGTYHFQDFYPYAGFGGYNHGVHYGLGGGLVITDPPDGPSVPEPFSVGLVALGLLSFARPARRTVQQNGSSALKLLDNGL